MIHRTVLLLQLPIPPLGPGRIRGNVPLAAGYLKMYAELQGLHRQYDIQIFPSQLANTLSEQGLIEAILERDPWMVGFTCYLWNIDRTLWITQQLKERRPELVIVLGGPEITIDNAWVLQQSSIDYFVIGEGEQTFAELLQSLNATGGNSMTGIPGLYAHTRRSHGLRIALPTQGDQFTLPGFQARHPLENLDQISSPYLTGILDAAEEEMLMLETNRGCIFKCKFCYYPKAYTGLHFLSREKIIANLRHAQERAAKEIVMLDPTLNQRKDFDDFLRLLIQENPGRRFTFFGELRAEGIKPLTAQLLAEANFTEVEVGLQSINPLAMQLMDRKNNLKAVEKGCQAMLDAGIGVKVDLIIGLPGDTVDSVRRSMHYLRETGIYSDVQVFNLAVLPGTAFRQEAEQLGLIHQPRPPYYVRRTPTLQQEDLFMLMEEAASIFEIDWDPIPEFASAKPVPGCKDGLVVDLSRTHELVLPAAADRHQAYTLWFSSPDFELHLRQACRVVQNILRESPFTTLQIVLEPGGNPCSITSNVLSELWYACQEQPSYMDRYYAMQPGRPMGAKRIIVVVDDPFQMPEEWVESVEEYATLAARTRQEYAIS